MSEEDLREQLEISKEFLEFSHGAAVRYNNPEKAKAYFDAISLVDDALEDNWDPERATRNDSDHFRELLEESRAAREAGVKAATLHDQSMEEYREKYHRPSLFDRFLPSEWLE